MSWDSFFGTSENTDAGPEIAGLNGLIEKFLLRFLRSSLYKNLVLEPKKTFTQRLSFILFSGGHSPSSLTGCALKLI